MFFVFVTFFLFSSLKLSNERLILPYVVSIKIFKNLIFFKFQVTVESDSKQLITRTSPLLLPVPPPPPPILAPKPFGKTIKEYRTVRRIDNDGETTPTMRSDKRTSNNSDKRLSTNSVPSHDDLMESIRRFGGSQNLGKK